MRRCLLTDPVFFSSVGLDPYATNNLWNCVLGMGIMWMGNYCTTQTEVARYSNVSSMSKARLYVTIFVNL